MNCQQTPQRINKPKKSLCFLVVKTEETFSSRDQTLVETTIFCDDNFFPTENHHSANPLLQRSLTL